MCKRKFPSANGNEINLITQPSGRLWKPSVGDEFAWLYPQRPLGHKAKLVGFCFGHQAIAQGFGRRVAPPVKDGAPGSDCLKWYIPNIYISLRNMYHYNHNDQGHAIATRSRTACNDFVQTKPSLVDLFCVSRTPRIHQTICQHILEKAKVDAELKVPHRVV